MKNPVAKNCQKFNKATVQRDRTKDHRPSHKRQLQGELRCAFMQTSKTHSLHPMVQ